MVAILQKNEKVTICHNEKTKHIPQICAFCRYKNHKILRPGK